MQKNEVKHETQRTQSPHNPSSHRTIIIQIISLYLLSCRQIKCKPSGVLIATGQMKRGVTGRPKTTRVDADQADALKRDDVNDGASRRQPLACRVTACHTR